jgi:hypothetical protein
MLVTEIVVAAGTIVGQFGLAHGLIGQCFAEGTAVLAVAGAVAIENIEIGDLVWAYDETTGDVALKEVVQTFENETYELTTVRTNDGQEIVSTPEHPYFVQDRGWILAKDLRAGDKLLNVNGDVVIVEWVQHEILENPITVYNFEVADYHTYFVAQNINAPIQEFVLVHNKCTVKFYEANRVSEGVQQGAELTRKQAINVARKGNDVLTSSRSAAKSLAKNIAPGKVMRHTTNFKTGYLPHFHPANHQIQAHIFFGW